MLAKRFLPKNLFWPVTITQIFLPKIFLPKESQQTDNIAVMYLITLGPLYVHCWCFKYMKCAGNVANHFLLQNH